MGCANEQLTRWAPGLSPTRNPLRVTVWTVPGVVPAAMGKMQSFLTAPRASLAAGFLWGHFRSWHFWVPCEKMDKSMWYHGKLRAGKWRSASWGRKMPSGVGTGTAQQGTSEVDGEDTGMHEPASAPGKYGTYELIDGHEGGQTRGWTCGVQGAFPGWGGQSWSVG